MTRLLLALLLLTACGQAPPPEQRPAAAAVTPVADTTYHHLPKFRGMTFAHEGYDGVRGYGGAATQASLDSLLQLNVNAIAVVPYTFMRDPTVATELPVPQRLGQETNAATVATIRDAHRRGLAVLLKPQIWLGGGHWPGDVTFDSEAEWTKFFGHYERWIMNYARMAEAEGVAALCIGTELVQTTLTHPEAWRHLIIRIREVYGGQLTYAANWGEEFEQLTFWDALDVIGLNNYYPLSEEDNPTDDELLGSARYWLRMAAAVSRRYGRLLWLTETGYRSVAAAWQQPHAGAEGRQPSPADQARCYRALLTAAGECDRLTGLFVWKWPSYLGRGHRRRRYPGMGFTPGGKPAGDSLATFYARWK